MNTRKKIIAASTAVIMAAGLNAAPAQAQTLPVQQSSVNQGTLVGAGSALAAVVVTLSLIIGSDVRGANKIIDVVNRETGNNTPHLKQPFADVLGH